MTSVEDRIYSALRLYGRQIRLLTILPTPTDIADPQVSPLVCKLEVRQEPLPELAAITTDFTAPNHIDFDHYVTNPPQEDHVQEVRREIRPVLHKLEEMKSSRRNRVKSKLYSAFKDKQMEYNVTIPIFGISNMLDADDRKTAIFNGGRGPDFFKRFWDESTIQRAGYLPIDKLNPFFRMQQDFRSKESSPRASNYVALSYAWGDPESVEEMTLNDSTTKIGSNLAAALRQFRSLDYFRSGGKIWIDQLCINQKDKREQAVQIKMMASIYRAAGNVVVWLGPSTSNSDLAIQFLEMCGTNYRAEYAELCDSSDAITATTWRTMAQIRMETNYKKWRARHEANHDILDAIAIPLYDFFDRPYWRRLWIIQELCMGHADMPIVCGKRITQWRHIRDGVLKYMSIIDLLVQITHQKLHSQGRTMHEHSLSHVAQIAQLEITGNRRKISKPDRESLPLVAPSRFEQGPLLGNPLRRAIILASRSFCSKSDDRIYGMLSIPALPTLDIEVDKNKDLVSVYTEFSAACVRHGSLDFFALLDGGFMSATDQHGNPQSKFKPSWVPDYGRKPIAQIGIIDGEFNAGVIASGYVSRGGWYGPEIAQDRFLICNGKVVDEVDGVGAMSKADIESGAMTFNREDDLTVMHQPRSTTGSEVDAPSSRLRKVYEVLVAGSDSNGSPAPETFSCLYSAFTEAEPPKTSPLYRNWHFINSSADFMIDGCPLASYFDHLAANADRPPRTASTRRSMLDTAAASQAMTACTKMRRLIMTADGLLGLAPAQTRPGDAVIVIKGHGKPVIARKDRTIDGQDFWYLIGEAYISGMMQAEKLPLDTNDWNYLETQAAAETLQDIIFV
ncbi:heterokaryon incompatibility protein [Paraphoma chrysanthemicola]|uniref:Heterokaryon incompatibility protein n=1 Tax=Paraphoma chrysanthemicola TaxID=798071 RepID=A0A8K0R6E8_9PLEO|nr:heterokaryon incompatibility protein [Paraphoma chrysanthemicola]